MDTSKYDSQTRKDLKRFQRTPGYQVMKKEHLAERERLETKIRERDATIALLKKKLADAGVSADEIAAVAA